MRWPAMMRLTCIGILAQFALLLLAFGVLTYCFLISDFSVIYVAQHSYSLLSWELKLAAVWGGHEGSLLLWVLLLSAWSALFAWHYRQQTDPLFPLTLAVLSLMLAALLLFVVLWSLLSWELKLAAVWGGHEGSLLLWVLLLSAWSALFAWHYRQQTDPLFPLTLAVLSLMLAALLLFVVLWSDPFVRIFPPAIEGRDLNPMLQHPGLIFHPPLL